MKLIVEDKEIVESKEEEFHPDLSLVSRVSESLVDNNLIDKSHNYQEHLGKETLFWDFTNSADKKLDSIVNTGYCSSLGNSHKSLCDLMKKIKIKGPGRPKRKSSSRHPFDFGKSRWFLKNRELAKKKGCYKGTPKILALVPGSDVEAAKILETVEALGMQLVKGRVESLEAVKN